MLKIGCHVKYSAANKYLLGALDEAKGYGANCFMIFLGAPHNTRRADFEKMFYNEFCEKLKTDDISIDDVVVHLPYIVNMGNYRKQEVINFSIEFIISEILTADKIGIKKLVLHPGSKLDGDLNLSLDSLADSLNKIIAKTKNSKSIICLETMAGKGNEIGKNFEQLAYVIEKVIDKSRIGVCFDTCHLHDAGYDLSNFDAVINQFDQVVGIEYLQVIHLNDSKNIIGAHKDRHENIGYGEIGFENLLNVVYHEKTKSILKILETPFIGDRCVYKEEIENIKNKKFVDFLR
ncbi:deoxyribonuclease IV [Spiroplasma endosymbiont of Aspidapion aeneum]|uniref:deoxyribonuclease IV n=1 Tax=Spiroplasma endosymbiont of Aspidapion aeneum TaxID=3066276 RepID=UPI00313D7BBE